MPALPHGPSEFTEHLVGYDTTNRNFTSGAEDECERTNTTRLQFGIHRRPSQRVSGRRVCDGYGSRAISRAFLIAVATSRCSRTDKPVTERDRILPRSDMNVRKAPVSL